MTRNVFIFNGKRSDEYGLYIGGAGTYAAPPRSYDKFTVPGRNGVLYADNGCFDNVTVTYEAAIIRDLQSNAAAIRAWLLSSAGYCRLEDTYNPDYFRLARYASGVQFSDFSQWLRTAKTQISFDCKPQRFLKSGEDELLMLGGNLYNQTDFTALPVLTMTMSAASASVSFGDSMITLTGASGDVIVLDAETLNATKGTANANSQVAITGVPLALKLGMNFIETIGLTALKIKPRWWTL